MAAATEGASDPLAAFVDGYLSTEHRDGVESSCGVVALGTDAPRASARVRAAYTDQVRYYLAELERLIGGPDADTGTRKQAVVTLSTLVGSLLVARAVDDPALSDELLRDVRVTLRSRAPGPDARGCRGIPASRRGGRPAYPGAQWQQVAVAAQGAQG